MILDCHIHIAKVAEDREGFARSLRAAGVDGGCVISLPPASFKEVAPSAPLEERLDNLFRWCEAGENRYPMYWVDPLEADALDQVDAAVKRGVAGFKVICDRFFPGDERAMPVYQAIADAGRPILFHSGILWDGKPSAMYNRPGGFEALLEVRGLRFCLAHISWPWCDELVAVYGKFLNARARRKGLDVEMFIDTTPGTPRIYRREALTKLFTVGYNVARNVLFGSDGHASDYNAERVRERLEYDAQIFAELGLDKETIEGVQGENLKRFLGLT